MKHTKQNKKRSTVVALVVAVACIVALVGATFAWFTDTASTATNKIQAGNLDVDLVMDKAGNGTYTSIADASEVVFGSANSLVAQNNNQDTVWEPGKTQIAYLGVKNAGNLALKYTIELKVTDNGLADALEYAFIEGAKASDLTSVTDWSTLKAAATQTGDVTAGTIQAAPNGLLDEIAKTGEQGETDYFVLAIHMKEDAGNSYKSKSADIDVTIKATQAAAEYDSFSNQYDKNASATEDDNPYLTFSSEAPFTLETSAYCYACYGDNGNLESSTNAKDWTPFKVVSQGEYEDDLMPSVAAVQNSADGKYYVYLRGKGMTDLVGTDFAYDFTTLAITGNTKPVDCTGNIMTLLDYENPDDVVMTNHALFSLFKNCTALRSAPSMPATTLAPYCYCAMFLGCTGLTSVPNLPATELADSCYYNMFNSCSSLETAPTISATNLANGCFKQMFYDCIKLTSAPEILATTAKESCFENMFAGCSSLVTAPDLSGITTLDWGCCYYMFAGCSNLTNASVPSAATLEECCYSHMYEGCTALNVKECLPTDEEKLVTISTTIPVHEWLGSAVECMFKGTINALNEDYFVVVDADNNGTPIAGKSYKQVLVSN